MYLDYITKRKIRSERTAETYKTALRVWARSRGTESPDAAIQEIRSKGVDPYTVLQDFVNQLHSRKLAPKTILSYVTALKGFLLDCDFDISPQKLRAKVVLPQQYEISTDRAPTVEEVRRLLLRGNLATKVAITMLCSSGLRLGELGSLRVCDIQFGAENEPAKIALKAAKTKSRKSRITFMTAEAAGLLKEYLGERIKQPDAKVFPHNAEAIYHRMMRTVNSAGLKTKMDSESRRYAIHPHSLRKFFFSNCLSAGLDRGLTEGFMGHNFALDSNYLRMSDDELKEQYLKAADRLTFNGGTNRAVQSRLDALEDENQTLRSTVEHLQKVEETRKPADDLMNTLLEDPEVQAFLKRRLKATSKVLSSTA
jgi:integrase